MVFPKTLGIRHKNNIKVRFELKQDEDGEPTKTEKTLK